MIPPVMPSCMLRSAVVASDLLLQLKTEQPGLLQGFSVLDVLHVPQAPHSQNVRYHQKLHIYQVPHNTLHMYASNALPVLTMPTH